MKSLRDPDRKPTHPGAILREDVLPSLRMTHTEFARLICVSRRSVSDLLYEKRALTPQMAVRLSKLLRTSPESWLRMQETLNLWETLQCKKNFSCIKPLSKTRIATSFLTH
ncbi:MAG: HigA family addiction module antidote protein [Burkholderiales bacterium]|nr:HigA family addiction module antidote protein [Burkholderiales bacterium]